MQRRTCRTCPYQLFIPALVICLIMFGFNFIGDGLRDALDPKLKKVGGGDMEPVIRAVKKFEKLHL